MNWILDTGNGIDSWEKKFNCRYIYNKVRINNQILKPIWTYDTQLWQCAKQCLSKYSIKEYSKSSMVFL